MNQKGRKTRNKTPEPPSGNNILFTLGLVSVIALLIVGWVMTQGGVNKIAEKTRGLSKIYINDSTTPTPKPLPTREPAVSQPMLDELKLQHQLKIEELRNQYEDRLEQQKNTYETQISDLKMRNRILENENKRLRGEQ